WPRSCKPLPRLTSTSCRRSTHRPAAAATDIGGRATTPPDNHDQYAELERHDTRTSRRPAAGRGWISTFASVLTKSVDHLLRALDLAFFSPSARMKFPFTAPHPLLDRLFLELRHHSLQLYVPGVESEQLAGVAQRRGEIPLVAGNRDERDQDVSIRRMLPVRLF